MKNFYKQEEIFINLTPLIDVIFVILISFILIAPFLSADKVNLSSFYSNESFVSGIKVYVRKNNSIWIDKKEIDKKKFLEKLIYLKKKFPKKNIELYHDKEAFFGTYQFVKNCAKQAGFEQIDVLLKNY